MLNGFLPRLPRLLEIKQYQHSNLPPADVYKKIMSPLQGLQKPKKIASEILSVMANKLDGQPWSTSYYRNF